MTAERANIGVVKHAGDENGGVDAAEQVRDHHDKEEQGNIEGTGGGIGFNMQPTGYIGQKPVLQKSEHEVSFLVIVGGAVGKAGNERPRARAPVRTSAC